MKQLDTYYRALLKYREHTSEDRECVAQRNAVAKANTESDKIVLTRQICTVDEDWVDAIEAGLEYIGKAIKEDRQFIRSNGEVVPIEKVKSVSKDSVSHLSRHSDLITRQTDSEDIIPDQLYTVEKLNEYAVYENRFLYMLLCYLRDFITMRYNRILELSNTYNGSMVMNKTAKVSRQTLCYEVKLTEERRDDKYLREHNEAREILDRIDLLLKAVLAYLGTPLMEMVSKAPMLKPPITKTNVLKMNNNFKQAMALYSFLVAYEKDGYSVETKTKELSPFRDEVAEELAETVLLSSFLTYEHSLGIEGLLKKSFEVGEQKRRDAEYIRLQEKIEALRKRLEKSGESPEEYILLLEKQIRALEKRCEELDRTRQELSKTKQLLKESEDKVASLMRNVQDLMQNVQDLTEELRVQREEYADNMLALRLSHEAEIQQLNEEHEQAILILREEHASEIHALREEYENAIQALREEHAAAIGALREEYEAAIGALREEHEREIQALREEHEHEIQALREEHEQELASVGEKHAEELQQKDAVIGSLREQNQAEAESHRAEISKMSGEHAKKVSEMEKTQSALVEKQADITEEKRILLAQLLALRKEYGLLSEKDQYRSKERFTELEHTFETFKRYYKQEWNQTKKGIRKELLKPEKKEDSKKTD